MCCHNTAKLTLKDYVGQIDQKLAEYFDKEMLCDFGFNTRQKQVVREMLLHSKEHNLRRSKRLRSSFVHYGYQLEGKKADDKIWQAAMAVELVHSGILMHDDIQDRDVLRRGGPTTHEFYRKKMGGDLHLGEAIGINAGILLQSLGYEMLAKCGSTDAMVKMLRGVSNTAYGQSYDILLEFEKKWSEDDIIALHKAKTAIYTYENPLFIGALLAKLPQKALSILHDYSMDGGVAFQLQDDILGVFGDEEETGKSADSDLKQGKSTLLVLKAFDEPTVQKVWGDMNATRVDLDAAKQVIINCGSLEYNRKLAKEFATKAAVTASKLRGLNLDTEAVDYIQGIAEYMVEREV
ncbi:MAG: hypothetical protein UU93_C0008G0001 [Candidatus Amesbacteria bacterium GW2011_GWA2_42_12]|uniref:Polyprenyl synthetase superfamily n=1 Tax=Candidatus Amesbacteria bacterium GW2011_GWA2_42_12 TaxID=1618356 RepID=A0A0G0Y679_9BACT|nr:MAG: hypothetical protein UU93_C0008G0001 [Candidatus Amesbacteria bacterium GW2011_GWA2_42_12]